MSEKNLYSDEAKAKLKELAESIDFAMLASNLGTTPFHAVPMSTKKVDAAGDIWFLSGGDSQHNVHIAANAQVQLLYSNPGSFQFMTVYGEAMITTDRSILEDLYGKSDDLWFDGLDDPNLTALKIKPLAAHYWDAKSNKLVTMFKMGVSLLTGDEPDISETGDLNL